MVDPNDPCEVQVAKQSKIIEALIARAERGHEVGVSAYSLFQSAISLQAKVWEKTKDLERALDTLGKASSELEVAYRTQERMQHNLADAMVAMDNGFALFTEERLQVCNTQFRTLLPDVEPLIKPGLDFNSYLAAFNESRYLDPERSKSAPQPDAHAAISGPAGGKRFSSFVVALRTDRWYQISHRQTSSGSIAVLQTEITDLVRENLREKERLIDQQAHLLQAAFEHMSLGVGTFSSRGELLVCNERFGHLLGLGRPLLRKGARFQRLIEHIERHGILEKTEGIDLAAWIRTVLRGGNVRQRLRRLDGIVLDMNLHSLPDDGCIVSIMDVTAETEAAALLEARVRERTAELTEANRSLKIHAARQAKIEADLRLAKEAAETAHTSKTRFLAAASHDLLQPINAAKLYLSTLADTVHEREPRDVVDRLNRSFASIESLLQALLDISRLDSAGAEFNVTGFEIGAVLETLGEDLAPLASEKGLDLVIVPSSLTVTSDRRYLSRCLQNLIVNAIQYTARGRILVGCRRRGTTLSIQVLDTGSGISLEDQERIFGEFARGMGSGGGGMGLGLSIVERACRHLNHRIGLTSRLGHGSMFSIDVPIAAPSCRIEHRPPRLVAMPEASLDLIVMVIENDEDERHAMTQKLESWGASVLAAGSTKEAEELTEAIGTPPDIILADYHLDDGDTGLVAIRALRRGARREIPAILITANRQHPFAREEDAQSITVMTKPVQLVRLRALIDWMTRARVA
ncbi:hybrid sensor histidine kinase/response regulator [Rhizobium halophytocola]|uniref:hybrid sensor histidine kinase/response regulator n=1 Tax=Rhizobium halophytocola TaxID=735519 RepID=UPI001AE9F98B